MGRAQHAEIAKDLAEQIASGKVPVGSLLPTEFELCERYDASRYTVRMALGQLQEQGLISRRKNVGTRVEASRPSGGFMQSLASVEDLAQFGATHVRVVRDVSEVVVDVQQAQFLGCPGGSRWLRISSLRMDGGRKSRPIGWTDVYIDPAYAEIGPMVREAPQTLISELIESRYGRRITRIRQDIRASTVPAQLSDELKVEAGSPALMVIRRYFDAADEVFEMTVTVHPAERFTFSMELTRSRE
ncbi:MAG TPA: GntR family transcriptional regulator [Piscinibacter sp.]|uniref:GntR family transcriptional regulator n=1 Tax=Piscinibacter sp. TaxID=1903157 RepID=UPI0011DA37B9|nr:GntR family transcriptional regulator [Piscinibacter sp.]MBS0436703.1 GntR family transcriptional regulator [Pseudomonadota bacterium]TXH64527.1 MAG: GntR family transcriptional regulator [Burkholderiaceae bacterium]MBP5991254.1 GntR family transcriptional regulator [Piscinibacter sp.]MBP6026559.1 GntR family transcriptional regulator [Piscinibacter sp.]HNK17178.1 GntR family transcriptional regulator [Piscinibacter sp.]